MTEDQKYIEGFNKGYLLQKHYPELAKQLSKSIESQQMINPDKTPETAKSIMDGITHRKNEPASKYLNQKKSQSKTTTPPSKNRGMSR